MTLNDNVLVLNECAGKHPARHLRYEREGKAEGLCDEAEHREAGCLSPLRIAAPASFRQTFMRLAWDASTRCTDVFHVQLYAVFLHLFFQEKTERSTASHTRFISDRQPAESKSP